MNPPVSPAERLRPYAVQSGFDENDPTLVHAVEALRKLKKKELSSVEADAALGPLIDAWIAKIKQRGPRRFLVVRSESNRKTSETLREWAQKAGIDENDAILLRVMKAEEKAASGTNRTSLIELNIAFLAFIEGHFEVRSACPPEWGRIEMLLHKFRRGKATPDRAEEFRRLASEFLRDSQTRYPPAFKTRIESALHWLDDPTRVEKMPDPFPKPPVDPRRPRPSMFPPRVPPSNAWLGGVASNYGIDENHPVVARVMEILRKSESLGISREEKIEFQVLNDGLNKVHFRVWRQKLRGVNASDSEQFHAEEEEDLGDKAYRKLARMKELSEKIGAGTHSKEELEEQCRLYAELDEKGLDE